MKRPIKSAYWHIGNRQILVGHIGNWHIGILEIGTSLIGMDIRRKHRFFSSLRHAIRGCAMLFGTERNAKIHLVAFILVTIAGFYFKIDRVEWMIILLASGSVIAAEALNTAIEGTIDIVHPERGEKAGRIKDIAAGAVLIVTLAAIACGVIIFYPKIAALFAH